VCYVHLTHTGAQLELVGDPHDESTLPGRTYLELLRKWHEKVTLEQQMQPQRALVTVRVMEKGRQVSAAVVFICSMMCSSLFREAQPSLDLISTTHDDLSSMRRLSLHHLTMHACHWVPKSKTRW
jgi:hypothetical protein